MCRQVLFACVRKIRVKPPKDDSQLYEVHDKQSAVKGSRKMAHTEQMRCVPSHVSSVIW